MVAAEPSAGGDRMLRKAAVWRGAPALSAFFVALAAALVAALPASAASAGTTTCTGPMTSGVLDQSRTIEGDVVVPAGASCALDNIVIDGNLSVGFGASASFGLDASRPLTLNGVAGNVSAVGAADLSIAYAHVGGSVTAVNGASATLYRSSVAKNLVFVGNDMVFLFSASVRGTATCQNNETAFVHEFGAGHASGQCTPAP
jgi:hypothetical protein